MIWPTDDQLVATWPRLGTIQQRAPLGGGLLLTTTTGPHHLKHRPVDRTAGELWLIDQAVAAGVPATTPLTAADGGRLLVTGQDAWFVYPALPGQALPRLLAEPGQAEQLGRACAELDAWLATMDVDAARAAGIPDRPSSQVAAGLPVQVIHRDLHAGNLLFIGDQVTGVLDLDHLEIGPRLVDLVYLAGSVLAELFARDAQHEFGERSLRLVAGHEQVSALSDAERAAAQPLLLEVEEDFRRWFVSTGDTHNAALTQQMIDFVAEESVFSAGP